MGRIMKDVGPYRPGDRTGGSHLHSLVRAIVFQQLSGKAATTILNRFLALFPDNEATAELILKKSDAELRAVGLSRQKMSYMRDLATKAADGSLPLDHVHTLDDEALIEHLIQVK